MVDAGGIDAVGTDSGVDARSDVPGESIESRSSGLSSGGAAGSATVGERLSTVTAGSSVVGIDDSTAPGDGG